MPDDVTINKGEGGAAIAADEIAGTHHQRVKLQHGADGSATDVSTASPLPANVETEPATKADGGEGLPAVVKVIGGYDSSKVQALATDSSGILQADISAALPTGTNTIGRVGLTPQSTGGLTIFRSIDLDETEEQVKATAGQLFGYYIYNNASSVVYVKLYNATEANVKVGETTPVMTLPIPALSAANVEFTNGIAFGTAITAAATTGVADADTGAPAANQVIANLLYL